MKHPTKPGSARAFRLLCTYDWCTRSAWSLTGFELWTPSESFALKIAKKNYDLDRTRTSEPARDNFPNTTVRHVKWIDQPKETKCLWSFSHRAKKNDVKKRAMAYSPKADFRAAEKTKDNNSNNNNKGSFYVCTRMHGCTYTYNFHIAHTYLF